MLVKESEIIYANKGNSGLYIHIPFCTIRCRYCDFYSQTNSNLISNYIDALIAEIESRKLIWQGEKFQTVYFGGGTPSYLSSENIYIISQYLKKSFDITPDAEWTIELNPEGVSKSYIDALHQMNFNRISMGVQSFSNNMLQNLGRIHDAERVLIALDIIRQSKFTNISIDLMFGLPKQTIAVWKQTLKIAFEQNVEHLSAYLLSLEPNTAMYKDVDAGRIILPNDDLVLEQYEILCKMAFENGFEHYEISNYAKPNCHSQHNSLYWSGAAYLGLGASAHSFNGKNYRAWNVSNIDKYIKDNLNGINSQEGEDLDLLERLNDIIITRLRTTLGIDIDIIEKEFGEHYANKIVSKAKKFCLDGKMGCSVNKIWIKEKHFITSDAIIRQIIF